MGHCFSGGRSQNRFHQKENATATSALKITPYETNSLCYVKGQSVKLARSGMATSFSTMNITNPLKGLVSKRRNRYKKDGFNLDLTYITDNIIAMGYPASNIEGVYRNHIDDVVKFLDKKHPDHYYIYNLCSERSYDKAKFHNRVKIFPFDDHNPPKIDSIQPFCNDVKEWLSRDEANVAVVHCKAGKGRTGTMICCYLLHSGMFDSADEALNYYGRTRTQDKKGVTIPSQVRYVRYYETLLSNRLFYTPVSMYIKEFILNPVPNFTGGQGCLSFTISHQTLLQEGEKLTQKCKKLRKNDVYEVKRSDAPFSIKLDYCLPLTGDIKVEFFNKTMMRKEKLFQFWFNTFFIQDLDVNGFFDRNGGVEELCYVLEFEKNELDIVNKKDKQNKVFQADFKLTVLLQRIPREDHCSSPYERPFHVQDTPSESSADSSDDYTNEEDDWDSGEGNSLLPSKPEHSCDVIHKS
uniref:Phosphatidylinositol 3,4,5-trisphosphate 3-phosphatase and dual-specificity protein phosphatase PTEN n=1 Tax=Leptinotarsa decemlineata TaxID=7539 RepID=A0A0M5L082_LEPDE|nr:PTEN [Leptinotarsa decemlineata]